ncbi:hypothetical protein FACS1894200_07970 [Spirochaetia bacterium]|nr:hypothetical protein FACS1894200_07970 [Spirochaetia bacterium]
MGKNKALEQEVYRLRADEEVRYRYEIREKTWRGAKAREDWVEKESIKEAAKENWASEVRRGCRRAGCFE